MIHLRFCCFGATSYIIDANYPVDLSRRSSKNEDGSLLLKNPAPGKAVSYAQNFLNAQIHVKKSVLTIKLAFVTRIAIGSV